MPYSGKPNRFLKTGDPTQRFGNLLYRDFWNEDDRIYRTIAQLQTTGTLVRGPHGRYSMKLDPSSINQPWLYIHTAIGRKCTLWHDLYFEHFRLIPEGCLNCWKTVISVSSVYDLFILRDILTGLSLPSKCGIDARYFTPNKYSGFIYGDSIGQGFEYYRIISEALEGNLDLKGKPRVILKRGCTEFEQEYPHSKTWRLSDAQVMFEKKLDSIFEAPIEPTSQQDLIAQSRVFSSWIKYAHGIGDKTWKQALIREGYDPPKDLYPPPDTYHGLSFEEIEEILNT